ncbi:MAG: RluA family pseudouridine synthase, partial [Lachnospiraceae bacterium]|nr:RluA family pseudouridine synthase [Lachnospiraceae bacterium]
LRGKKAAGGEIIAEGDVVSLFLSDETIRIMTSDAESGEEAFKNVDRGTDLRLIEADQDAAFFSKPAGLLTQPDRSGSKAASDLIPGILIREGILGEEDLRAFSPAPLNRLDRNTIGLIIAGTSMRGARLLSELIASRQLKKEYLVLTTGTPPEDGIYRAYAVKDTGRNYMRLYESRRQGAADMVTGFQTLGKTDRGCLIKAELITGRTHQIRAHLAYLGSPVAGDVKYGSREENARLRALGVSRQMLHAFCVTFPKDTGPCPQLSGRSIVSDVPDDFRKLAHCMGLDHLI